MGPTARAPCPPSKRLSAALGTSLVCRGLYTGAVNIVGPEKNGQVNHQVDVIGHAGHSFNTCRRAVAFLREFGGFVACPRNPETPQNDPLHSFDEKLLGEDHVAARPDLGG